MNDNTSQQAQAVTNTLAGERIVQTVHFPSTGDREMDFIGGLIAVWEAIPIHPFNAARAAEYFLHRVKAAAKEREAAEQEQARSRSEEAWLEKNSIQPFPTGGLGGTVYPQCYAANPPGHQTPLPHPPEFAQAIQQRELERAVAQIKALEPFPPAVTAQQAAFESLKREVQDRTLTDQIAAIRAALCAAHDPDDPVKSPP